MALFDDEQLYSDAQSAPPMSPLVSPPQPGIGLAPPSAPVVQPRMDPQQEAISKMSGSEKFFGAIGEVGAAFQGKPSPMLAQIESKRKDRLLRMEEDQHYVKSLKTGLDLLDNLTGDARTAAAENYAQRLDANGMGDTFRLFAKEPDFAKQIMEDAQNSPTLSRIVKSGGIKAAAAYLKTKDGRESVQLELDTPALEKVYKKIDTFKLGIDKFLPKEMASEFGKDGILTRAELRKGFDWIAQNNPEVAKGLGISAKEWSIIERNFDRVAAATGLATAATEQKVLADRAKGDKAESTIGKIKADLKAGRITQAEADAAIAKANKESGVTINMPSSSGFGVNPDTGKPGHFTIGKDGKIRWDPVEPLPKPTNPIQAAVAAAISGAGNGGPAPKPAAGRAKPVPTARPPAGIPAGSKKIGKSPDGKDVWQAPDGKKYTP